MRRLTILAVLALAACNENAGWNPNYTMSGTRYGDYQRAREATLVGNGPISPVIPIELPAKAPTAADIAGTTTRATGATRVTAKAPARPDMPVTTSGPYAGSTPVLVRYAFQEKHNPGKAVYTRSNGSTAAAQRACAKYGNAATAQTAFIAAGGPLIDPNGMDPDGDGFVCGWDPRPYRQQQL